MKQWFSLFLFVTAVLHANEEGMTIQSDNAEYNGRLINLAGHVSIEHDLGTMSAGHVTIIPESPNNKMRCSEIILKDNVRIIWKSGGELQCEQATLDYGNLSGTFQTTGEKEAVIYTEKHRDEKGKESSLTIKSKQMNAHLRQEQLQKGNSPHHAVSSLGAEKNVVVQYNDSHTAHADFASYQRIAEEESPTQMPGVIVLRAADDNGLCRVISHDGDLIDAHHICIDTIKQQILFAYPKGTLHPKKDGIDTNRIDFSSDILTWDNAQHILTLQDHVSVIQPGLGTLATNEQIQFFQDNTTGQLKTISSKGNTTLHHVDKKTGLAHTLNCYGTVVIDHSQLTTTMDSPKDAQDNVLEGKQVTFKDSLGEILADKMTITYALNEDSSPIPKKFVLEGHVRILNQRPIESNQAKTYLEYALADCVEYLPEAKEVTLSANGKGRVLFYDKINHLEISAPALKVHRDQITKKESVRGVGHVRFKFIKEELQRMQHYFSKSNP